ncbi:hypothetical protein BURK2_02037 [Burkholderiales bacterium]|nr:hypothetical protein BURK2_02037 [Burkholderiales bacterium]
MDFGARLNARGFEAIRARILPATTSKSGHPAVRVLFQDESGSGPTEILNPKLVYMPEFKIEPALFSALDGVDLRLARAFARFAAYSSRNEQGTVESFCGDEVEYGALTSSEMYKVKLGVLAETEKMLESHGKRGYSSDEVKALRASMPPRDTFYVYFDVDWDLADGQELPDAVSIKYRDPKESLSGYRGVKLSLEYAKAGNGEPFSWIREVTFLPAEQGVTPAR